jgi:hypothetical protein
MSNLKATLNKDLGAVQKNDLIVENRFKKLRKDVSKVERAQSLKS